MKHGKNGTLVIVAALASGVLVAPAWAQDEQTPPTAEPAQPEQPAPPAQPEPPAEAPEPPAVTPPAEPEAAQVDEQQGLRIHVISTRRTYVPLEYDIFSVASGEIVGNGRGAVESRGENPPVWELPPGLYKIVKHGEPYSTRSDFATAVVLEAR